MTFFTVDLPYKQVSVYSTVFTERFSQGCVLFTFAMLSITDIIILIINSSLDNPIETSQCASVEQRNRSGNFEFRNILDDVSNL